MAKQPTRSPAQGRAKGGRRSARPGPARRLDTEARRIQLIEVAKGFFSKRAYDEVKVERIAARAGVSEALVYHYFPTKRKLYAAVIRSAGEDMAAAVEPDPSLPPLERLSAAIDAYLTYIEQNAEGYRTLHQSGIGWDPEILAIRRQSTERRVKRLVEAIAVGAQPPKALELAVRGWLGFMESACVEWLRTRDVPRHELRDLCAQVLIAAALTAWPQDARPPQARIDLPGSGDPARLR